MKNPIEATQPTECTTQYATSQTIKYIFAKLQARYGSKFSGQYHPNTMPLVQNEWHESLSWCTAEDIKRGLETWQEDWPPNVVEFTKACRKPKSAPYHKELEGYALPAPSSKELAKKCLAKMRAILRGQADDSL